LLYCGHIIEMRNTWWMLWQTGQSLRETTGAIYHTREMKEKEKKTSTTLPQLLTAASYISLGGTMKRWLKLLFIFGDMFIFIYTFHSAIQAWFYMQPHMLQWCRWSVLLEILGAHGDHLTVNVLCILLNRSLQMNFSGTYREWWRELKPSRIAILTMNSCNDKNVRNHGMGFSFTNVQCVIFVRLHTCQSF